MEEKTAEMLPPADFDQRTLDSVESIINRRILASKYRETAVILKLARDEIRRVLGGVA